MQRIKTGFIIGKIAKWNLILNNSTNIKGFTLAEVLVTLVVIGIVAALSIPGLLQSTKDAEFKTGLKAASAILNQTIEKIKLDNAGTIAGIYSTKVQVRDGFASHLNYTKKCNSGLGVCWSSNTYGLDGVDYAAGWSLSAYASLVLNNGILISFGGYSGGGYGDSTCTSTWFGEVISPVLCGEILVDVNGLKPPNKIGKDIYFFWLTSTGVIPKGSTFDIWSNPATICTVSDLGRGCAAKYLKGG